MAKRRKLLWQLFIPFLLLLLGALAVMALFVLDSVKQFYLDQNRAALEAVAHLIDNEIGDRYLAAEADAARRFIDAS